MMIKRKLTSDLIKSIEYFPAVAILGPRQVGKTTLALELAQKRPSLYLDLESDADFAKLSEPELYLEEHSDKLVILDEVQRMPHLFKNLRGLIDRGRRRGLRRGRFLLLGSASLELLHQSGESLAGRVSYHELTPFQPTEVPKQLDKLWLRGGFPESLLASNDQTSLQWRRQFIKTYLERDIPILGPRIPAETLRRFWTMLAHRQMTTLNAAELARSLGVDGKTVAKYLDLLADLMLVRRLPPWHGNLAKRLVKSPKILIRDSGLAHALLDIGNREALLSHPISGSSWEAFVIETLINSAPENTHAFFYRTSSGAEIDLILEFPDRHRWAIEVKRSLSPKLQKGFHFACEDIDPTSRFVVYPGRETFSLSQGVLAISLLSICEKLTSRR